MAEREFRVDVAHTERFDQATIRADGPAPDVIDAYTTHVNGPTKAAA